ncbi:MAG: HAD family phosphatase [Elusimicrobiota bacterium]|jgi:2-haloacid dehalogenase|nr:HAD family phosphatase [Elusimicrobiota bacterium]
MAIKNIVFDFEGVFIKYVPFNIFKKYFPNKEAMEKFFLEINKEELSYEADMGLSSYYDLIKRRIKEFPQYAQMLSYYNDNWIDAIVEIPETIALAKDLKRAGYKLFGLSNFAFDKTKEMFDKFNFQKLLDGFVVSSFVGVIKPDVKIYKLLCDKFNISPQESIFFDDRVENVEGAKKAGLYGEVFTTAAAARRDLLSFGIDNI